MHKKHKAHKAPLPLQEGNVLLSRFSLAAIILTIICSTTIAIVTRNNNEIVLTASPLTASPSQEIARQVETRSPTDPIIVSALYAAGSTELIVLTHLFGTKILRFNNVQADYLAGIMFLFLFVFYFVYVIHKKENATPGFVKTVQVFASLGLVSFLYNFGMVFMRHRRDQAKKLKRAGAEMARKLKNPDLSVVVPEGSKEALNKAEDVMRSHAESTRFTKSAGTDNPKEDRFFESR